LFEEREDREVGAPDDLVAVRRRLDEVDRRERALGVFEVVDPEDDLLLVVGTQRPPGRLATSNYININIYLLILIFTAVLRSVVGSGVTRRPG